MTETNVSTTIEITSILAAQPDVSLTMEQEPFPDPEGENFVIWLSNKGVTPNIFSIGPLYQEYLSACDDSAGFTTRVFVRPTPADLQYSFAVTHGEVGERTHEEIDSSARYTFELTDTVPTNKSIMDIVSAEWEPPLLDEFGQTIAAPPIEDLSIVGTNLVLPYKIYGTVNLKFREEYDVYEITIPKRSDEEADPEQPEAIYDTIAVAIYAGRIAQLKIEAPPLIGNCEGGYENKVDPEEPEPPPDTFQCYDLYIKYERCSGIEISREEVPVPCSGEEG